TCDISQAPTCGGTCPTSSQVCAQTGATSCGCVCDPALPCPFIIKWGSQGSQNGQFQSPWGIAVDGSGKGFGADHFNHRIQEFTNTGTFIRKWGGPGGGDGQFSFPTGVAVDGTGNVYVADSNNDRIQEFTNTGTFIRKWGSLGSGDGQFFQPVGIAVDGMGNVYGADGNVRRTHQFPNPPTSPPKCRTHA